MAKDLSWFKFFVSEYMAGDIIFCSDAAQGLFTRIMCVYWARECNMTFKQLTRHFEGKETLIRELISEGVIKHVNDRIHINFMDEQKAKWIEQSPIKSAAGKEGGRGNKKQKESRHESKTKADTKAEGKQTRKQNESRHKAIEKRKEEDFSPKRGNKSEHFSVITDQKHTLGLEGPAPVLVKSQDEIKKRGYFLDSISDYKFSNRDTERILELWDELLPENVNAFYIPFQRDFRTEENSKKRPAPEELIERLEKILNVQDDETT